MKFALLGDFILSEEFQISDLLLKVLQGTDFNLANLEAPFIWQGMKPSNGKDGLMQLTDDCSLLHKLNIKAVSLANNHITDFGIEGITNTIKKLEKENILYFGVGENLKQALMPAIIEIDGVSLGFNGFQSRYLTRYNASNTKFGTADINEKNFRQAVLDTQPDYRIFYMHWNWEYEYYPEPYFLRLSKKALNYTDIVCGSHPHCIQGYQESGNKLIFHSLGNFSIPHKEYYNRYLKAYRDKCYRSFFPVIEISEKKISYELFPYQIEDNGTSIFYPKKTIADEILKKVEEISVPLLFTDTGYLKFYYKNRIRKTKNTLTRCHIYNIIMKRIRHIFLKLFAILESSTVFILEKTGIYKPVKKIFAPLIDKIHKIL